MQSLVSMFIDIAKGGDWYDRFLSTFLPALDDRINVLLGIAATSTTSLAIGTGSKTFALTPSDREIPVGSMIRARRASDPTAYMIGLATASSAGSVTIDATATNGAGTYTDWIVGVDIAVASASTAAEGVVELATSAEGQAGSDTARAMTPAATKAAALYQGTHTFFIDASVFRPRESGGPEIVSTSAETATNKIRIDGLAFDASSIERAIGRLAFGKSWNKGTITAKFLWRAASGSGDVVWGIRGLAVGHDDALEAAFGTAQTTTSTLTATGDLVVSSATAAMTIAGTPANGDVLWLEVYRDATSGSDTLAADAVLLGVELTLTIDAANDA